MRAGQCAAGRSVPGRRGSAALRRVGLRRTERNEAVRAGSRHDALTMRASNQPPPSPCLVPLPRRRPARKTRATVKPGKPQHARNLPKGSRQRPDLGADGRADRRPRRLRHRCRRRAHLPEHRQRRRPPGQRRRLRAGDAAGAARPGPAGRPRDADGRGAPVRHRPHGAGRPRQRRRARQRGRAPRAVGRRRGDPRAGDGDPRLPRHRRRVRPRGLCLRAREDQPATRSVRGASTQRGRTQPRRRRGAGDRGDA